MMSVWWWVGAVVGLVGTVGGLPLAGSMLMESRWSWCMGQSEWVVQLSHLLLQLHSQVLARGIFLQLVHTMVLDLPLVIGLMPPTNLT